MGNIPTNILAFVIVLGPLIFFHEAGHFLLAKAFGVRVLVFSFGFGRRLFGFRAGGTDYRVSLIPLGGYVRMAGDTPDDGSAITATGAPDEFLSKPKWQRFLILFAGPAMNVLIAIALLTILAMVGIEYRVIKPVIGTVFPNKPAARAGLQPGDQIVRVGSEEIKDYDDLRLSITMNAGTPLRVEFIRNGRTMFTTLTPERETSEYGPIGRAGITPRMEPIVGRVIPNSFAAKNGVRTGDRIISINGTPVTDMLQVDTVLDKTPNAPFTLGFQRGSQTFLVNYPPAPLNGRDPYRGFLPPTEVRKLGLVAAIGDSIHENLKMLRYAYQAIARIFTQQGSIKDLSGPASIAKISGDMFRRGWIEFVALVAMISLQLGIMNLLPIPVLDGGHIAILAVEGVARRDLSLRAKERVQQLGFALLAALMIVVLYNDVITNVARLKN